MDSLEKSVEREVAELFEKRFGNISLYAVIMFTLAVAILWTGVETTAQVQTYYQDYRELQELKKELRILEIEHQRLLIEQQTFSATPQIAARAVSELRMFSPRVKDTLVLQPQELDATELYLNNPALAASTIAVETEVKQNTAANTLTDKLKNTLKHNVDDIDGQTVETETEHLETEHLVETAKPEDNININNEQANTQPSVTSQQSDRSVAVEE